MSKPKAVFEKYVCREMRVRVYEFQNHVDIEEGPFHNDECGYNVMLFDVAELDGLIEALKEARQYLIKV